MIVVFLRNEVLLLWLRLELDGCPVWRPEVRCDGLADCALLVAALLCLVSSGCVLPVRGGELRAGSVVIRVLRIGTLLTLLLVTVVFGVSEIVGWTWGSCETIGVFDCMVRVLVLSPRSGAHTANEGSLT